MYVPSIISNVTDNKNEPLKTFRLTSFQKPTIAIRFYLLQVCPSVPPFVFAALFIPSFHVLSGLFFCFTQFWWQFQLLVIF